MVLDDFQTPRVQAHAGAALVNFCEQCPKSILLDYLEVIVAKLENVFRVKLDEVNWNEPAPSGVGVRWMGWVPWEGSPGIGDIYVGAMIG